MSPLSDRRRARELTLQACYAHELSENEPATIVADVILSKTEAAPVLTFAEDLFRRTVEHKDEFDQLIKEKAVNWEFNRIAILDKLILRMAICEFLYFEDIPPKVSIDEAIEIAKKFSTEKSGRFVNGILDAVLIDLRKAGRLRKKGRGLNDGPKRDHSR
ncbi:MAG: transcription antitermination factor NusB [candidate division KSB1 bacterium]|nr:transcription antitermination factor NusB [candidate division KSB1 bacterium]MDZ7286446.1 transcription antitermination factor NusB [candidate division KSB1 bacterium]MDZ7299390.1 transcription antitermination factor NusB [candidate division KSB1 bacterium]MDZ7307832.1 transcription antitermination factor NusB [candidate division KSB1 bacterium]MDZ7350254.1 transcription antitermination factor NusB [candidate division KSB1 bacterium]